MFEILLYAFPFMVAMCFALIGMCLALRWWPETAFWFVICLAAVPFYVQASVFLETGLEGWLLFAATATKFLFGAISAVCFLAGCWDNYAKAANGKIN